MTRSTTTTHHHHHHLLLLLLLLPILALAEHIACSEGHDNGPCEYCDATVAVENSQYKIRIKYELHLDETILPHPSDFSVSINQVVTPVTHATFIDAQTIDLTFQDPVTMEDKVTWSYTKCRSITNCMLLIAKDSREECNTRKLKPVTNLIQAPQLEIAFVYDTAPNTIAMQWSQPLNHASPLTPSDFAVSVRKPPNQVETTHAVVSATYTATDAIQLIFDGAPILLNAYVVTLTYTGVCIQSKHNVTAFPILPQGTSHEGFRVENRILSADMSFTAKASCIPYARRSQIEIVVSSKFKFLTPADLVAMRQDFIITKLNVATNQTVATFHPSAVELDLEQGAGKSVHLTTPDPIEPASAFQYSVHYIRPPKNSTRQFVDPAPSVYKVLGNCTAVVASSIETEAPRLFTAAMVQHDGVEVLRLEFTEPFDQEENSPFQSQVELQDWLLFLEASGATGTGKTDFAKRAEFCAFPEACLNLYLKDPVDTDDITLFVQFKGNPTHVYDQCGNKLQPFGPIKAWNLLPPVTPVTPISTTPSSSSVDANPKTPSSSPAGGNTPNTPSTPSSSKGTSNTVPGSPGTKPNTDNSDKDNGGTGVTPSAPSREDTRSKIVWITAGSIVGLLVGCGCLYFCFPCSGGKSGARRGARRGGKGPGKTSGFNDRVGGRHSGKAFGSFTDEFSDEEEDVNILQMGPVGGREGGLDEFDDF